MAKTVPGIYAITDEQPRPLADCWVSQNGVSWYATVRRRASRFAHVRPIDSIPNLADLPGANFVWKNERGGTERSK